MFSALKKRWTRQDDGKISPFPSGVAAIGQAMQAKFSKGVQYNMKIVIRGERNTGKSCLLTRLQGKPFSEAYIPTQEIQAASINWKYRTGDDVVKVEVWDIVDKGQKKKQKQDKLKISNEASEAADDGLALDAALIDVYKGTHGVIMLLDMTKPWTWKYIERELPRVPNHLPVLVMANFRDMGEHRSVDNETMLAVIEHLDRPVGSAEINFVESSLKSGFGLRYLYQFLNMPFLILQRETLLRQLEANALEIEETREILLRDEEKEDQNYDKFILSLSNRKVQSSGTATPSSETDESVSDSQSKEMPTSPATPVTSLPPTNVRQSAVTKTNNVVNGRNYTAKVEISETAVSLDNNDSVISPTNSSDIHDFTPDADLDPGFLEGNEKRKKWWNRKQTKKEPEPVAQPVSEDESDDEGGNPLVMDYQDFDSDDETPAGEKSESKNVNYEVKADETESDEDIDDDDKEKESDSDDSDHENPLVTAPVDVNVSDDDNEMINAAVTELKSSARDQVVSANTKTNDEEHFKEDDVKEAVQENEVSSDDEDDGGVRYEVAGDFDLEEPSIDDWLGGEKKGKKIKRKDKVANKRGDTKEMNEPVSVLSDQMELKRDNASPPVLLNDVNEADNNVASFIISADDLDLFASEQMRKTSISQEHEESEKKKPKKKKEKKSGEGEKKKKKKSSAERTKVEDGEQEERKKKTKSKDGKKKKSSKRTTEASNESKSYELL